MSAQRIWQGLFWGGLALAALGGVMFAVPALQLIPPALPLGLGLAALGVNVLGRGELTAAPPPRSFTARGQVVRGTFTAAAGLCDLILSETVGERIAQVQFGPAGEPDFAVEDGVARLALEAPRFPPAANDWRADLASNVLWDVDARASLGHLLMDLRDLRLERASARTSLGRIHVALPQRGYAEISLRSTMGEIEVTIPDGVGVEATVRGGRLSTVTVENKRLLAPGRNRYVTADYNTALAQVLLTVETASGDVIFS